MIFCDILSSSGHPRLDEAALESIRLSQPFPARPPELGSEPLTFTIPYRFQARSP